jgi:hypothetical protein
LLIALVYIGDGSVDPLEKEIRELADSILGIKAEQEYIVARERRHRDSKFFFFFGKIRGVIHPPFFFFFL